ncbi:MAG: site-specific integrase [Caulobacter sp.]
MLSDAEALARLFDADGARKYLCASEWKRFVRAAEKAAPQTQALCLLLALTGCRVSEALAVTPARLDRAAGRVVFRTLKRRRRVFRAVPIPPELMRALCDLAVSRAPDAPLWPWCRQTAWRRVKDVMHRAGIVGPQATPKGLRHAFGIANAEDRVPPGLTQRWMGHAKLETTTIYTHAVGQEERSFARRLWRRAGAH